MTAEDGAPVADDLPWIYCEHSQGRCRSGWHSTCTNRAREASTDPDASGTKEEES